MKTVTSRARPINAEVHFLSAPAEAPVGALTQALFGKSIYALAAEISANSNGAWNHIYKEG